MNENTIVLPPEIEALIAERSDICGKFDSAKADLATLKSLGSAFGTSGDTTEVSNLTTDSRVPDEINAAIREFRAEKEQLEKLNREINTNRDEIEAIRSHASNMYKLIAVVTVILIIIVAFWVMRGM